MVVRALLVSLLVIMRPKKPKTARLPPGGFSAN
jgi:hypothetical protein